MCDGNNDCPNMFDENPRTCPNTTVKSSSCDDGFLCSTPDDPKEDQVETCLSWNFVCNGKRDCPNGDDEGNSEASLGLSLRGVRMLVITSKGVKTPNV